ncbi:MAG: BON domain-containing protein [Betaproteobacteria bacterium]
MSNNALFKFLAAFCMTLLLAACAGTVKQESTGQLIDDSIITTRVKAALLKDSVVGGFEVSVESFEGAVQLGGFVKTDAQRERAVRIANDTPGVNQVFNSIQLR